MRNSSKNHNNTSTSSLHDSNLKKLFIARRRRRSSLGVPDAAEEVDTPRYSTISSLNHYLQNLINSALRRSLPFLLDAPLDLGWELGSHSFLTSHSSSPPLVRECFAPPLAYLFRRRVLTVVLLEPWCSFCITSLMLVFITVLRTLGLLVLLYCAGASILCPTASS